MQRTERCLVGRFEPICHTLFANKFSRNEFGCEGKFSTWRRAWHWTRHLVTKFTWILVSHSNRDSRLISWFFSSLQLTPLKTDIWPSSLQRSSFIFHSSICTTSRQDSVDNQKSRQQEDGRHWGYHDSAVFMLHSTTAEPNEKTPPPTLANRSIDDRQSNELCSHRYAWWLTWDSSGSFIDELFAGHIGSNDAELSSQHLTVIQSQMQSKGGYDINSLRMQVR